MTTRASHYGDAMRELDDAIGQILERVRQDSSRATLVLFTSDNGADLNARERAGGGGMGSRNIGVFPRIKWTPALWQADNL